MDRRIFIYSFLVTFFINSLASVFYLFPPVLQQWGISLSLIGWLMSMGGAGSLLSRPFGSYLTEKMGLKRGILIMCLVMIAVTVPLIWMRTFVPLLIIRLAVGFIFGMAIVVIMAYQALVIPLEKRGSIYAWLGVAYVLPQVIVIPPAEYAVSNGWINLYLAMVPAFALLTLVFALFLPDTALSPGGHSTPGAAREQKWGKWREIRAIRGFWLLLFGTIAFAIESGSTLMFMPAYIKSRDMIASAFMVVNGSTALLWRIAAYRLMDTLNRRRAMGVILAGMGCSLIFICSADSNIALMAGGFLFGTFMGIGFPVVMALVPDIFPSHLIPKGVSVSMFAMDLGFILSPVLAGYLGQLFDLGNVFTLVGTGGILSGIVVHLATRQLARKSPGQ